MVYRGRVVRGARRVLVLTLLLAFTVGARAQETEPEPAAGLVAASFPAAATLTSFLPLVFPETAAVAPWIANPILLGAHVPMYWVDWRRALWYTGGGLLLPGAGVPLMFASSTVPVAGPLSQSLISAYAHLMDYAAYDVYRLERPEKPGFGLGTLAAAPFRWENLSDPLVWGGSLASAAVLATFYLLNEPDLGRPVYETGMSRFAGVEVSPLVGGLATLGFGALDMLSVAVGEEAYYRGLVHEAMRSAWGVWPARVVDMVLFPLVHLPGDLRAGFKPSTVAFNFLWRSGMTLLLDLAYTSGRLPRSVALHYWGDLALVMARWVFYGG